MRPAVTPEIIYERLLAAGVAEPGVVRFGPQESAGARCVAGRWVPTGTLGVRDVVMTGSTKGLEVIATAATWQELDDALGPAIELIQPDVPTSRVPPDPTVVSPPPPDVRDDIEDAVVVPDSAPHEKATNGVPHADPSVEQVRALESAVVRAHGAEPIERT